MTMNKQVHVIYNLFILFMLLYKACVFLQINNKDATTFLFSFFDFFYSYHPYF